MNHVKSVLALTVLLAGTSAGCHARSANARIGNLASPEAGQVRINAIDGAAMVFIPAGTFKMGDDDQSDNPRHKVTLSGYWIYKNPVTVAQYKEFCHATRTQMPGALDFDMDWSKEDHPIVNVSWENAKRYCDWAGVTLPTEAQWERAARGTDGRKYPWGNEWDGSKCANSVGQQLTSTAAVGRYTDSPYGLSDMAGNVLQWCADWYDDHYCREGHGSDPRGPASGHAHVMRGGDSGFDLAGFFRASYRRGFQTGITVGGFRCAAKQ